MIGTSAIRDLVSDKRSFARFRQNESPAEAGGHVAKDAENWMLYPSDDFEGSYLRRRWLIRNTAVTVHDGCVRLANENGSTGAILLKGCYDNRSASGQGGKPKIYLRWPWMVETRLRIPSLPTPTIPFCAKLGLNLCNDQTYQAPVEIMRCGGFGANWVEYRIEKKTGNYGPTQREVNTALELVF
jgi:hypothetical protein